MPRYLLLAVMTASVALVISTALGASAPLINGTSTYIFITLDAPHTIEIVPEGINDHGQLVGGYSDELFGLSHAFIYDDGVFTTIDFPAGSDTVAFGINNDGNIVGSYVSNQQHGFLYDSVSARFSTVDVPFPSGVFSTRANGINNHDQIVGEYLDHPRRAINNMDSSMTMGYSRPLTSQTPIALQLTESTTMAK